MSRKKSLNLLLALVPAACLLAGCSASSSPDPKPNLEVALAIRVGSGAEAESAAEETPKGTGWGSLKGVFVYQGAPPAAKTLSTGGKDPGVCDAKPLPDQFLVVDPQSKGIANVVIYARKVSRVNEESPAAKTDAALFDQKQCLFLEHVKVVRVGQKITVKNSDPIGHNTNISPPGDQSFNPLLPGGSTADYSFGRPQNAPVGVSCNIHPWMKAYILPRKDFYAAVTAKDGSFQIPNLPAGEEVEFQVWHESGAGPQNALVAKPEWSGGRFKVTIPENGEQDLGTIEVPGSAFR